MVRRKKESNDNSGRLKKSYHPHSSHSSTHVPRVPTPPPAADANNINYPHPDTYHRSYSKSPYESRYTNSASPHSSYSYFTPFGETFTRLSSPPPPRKPFGYGPSYGSRPLPKSPFDTKPTRNFPGETRHHSDVEIINVAPPGSAKIIEANPQYKPRIYS